jgi:hypothetical protein
MISGEGPRRNPRLFLSPGLKPRSLKRSDAALKGRSSTTQPSCTKGTSYAALNGRSSTSALGMTMKKSKGRVLRLALRMTNDKW